MSIESQNLALGLNALTELLRQGLAVSQLVAQSNAENRQLQKAELDAVTRRADESEIRRDEAIVRAEEEGR